MGRGFHRADAVRAQLLTDVDRDGITTKHTVRELFERVIDHLETLGRAAVFGYRQIAKSEPETIGRMPVSKLRAGNLDRYYSDLIRSGLSAATIRRRHAFTRRSLAQEMRRDWGREKAANRASPPSEPRRRFEVQSADAVVALIEEAKASRIPELAVAFRLLAGIGGRRGEVCGLQ